MSRVCPKCGSSRIHRSHRCGVGEHLLALTGLKSRRCHECNVRFVTIGQSVLFRKDIDRLVRGVSIVALAGVALLLVVGLVVWLSRKEAAPSPTARAMPAAAAVFLTSSRYS